MDSDNPSSVPVVDEFTTENASRRSNAATERLCSVCGKRTGNHKWGESGIMVARGHYSWRCGQCCAREQLVYALTTGQLFRIPILVWRAIFG